MLKLEMCTLSATQQQNIVLQTSELEIKQIVEWNNFSVASKTPKLQIY